MARQRERVIEVEDDPTTGTTAEYTVDAVCSNCKLHKAIRIPTGTTVDETLCPQCNCRKLSVYESPIINIKSGMISPEEVRGMIRGYNELPFPIMDETAGTPTPEELEPLATAPPTLNRARFQLEQLTITKQVHQVLFVVRCNVFRTAATRSYSVPLSHEDLVMRGAAAVINTIISTMQADSVLAANGITTTAIAAAVRLFLNNRLQAHRLDECIRECALELTPPVLLIREITITYAILEPVYVVKIFTNQGDCEMMYAHRLPTADAIVGGFKSWITGEAQLVSNAAVRAWTKSYDRFIATTGRAMIEQQLAQFS